MSEKAIEKKPNIFKRMGRGVRDMHGEMKRVVWPTRKQTMNNTIIVICFMLLMAAVICTLDLGLSWIVQRVFGQ